MKLIVFATLIEAKSSLLKLKAKSVEDNLYRFDEGLVVLSGVGALAACSALFRYGGECSEIINLGAAGALNPALELHSIQTISSVKKHLSFPENIDSGSRAFAMSASPLIPLENSSGRRLLSSDFPLFTTERTQEMAECDLVDMEGYGLAFAARLLKKRLTMIKVVSDFARAGDRALLHRELERLSEILSEAL